MTTVYVHGSEAAGTASAGSDIDVVVITDETLDRADLAAIVDGLPLDHARPLDLTVATADMLELSHLWRNALLHARLLHGQPVTLSPPDPAAWAAEARNAALLAAIRDAGPRDHQAAMAWLAAAQQVEAGGPIPAGKHSPTHHRRPTMSTRQLVQAALDSILNEARQTRHEQLTAQRAAVVQQLAATLDGWPDNIVITPAQQQLVADIDELTTQLASLSPKHDEQLAVLMANVSP